MEGYAGFIRQNRPARDPRCRVNPAFRPQGGSGFRGVIAQSRKLPMFGVALA